MIQWKLKRGEEHVDIKFDYTLNLKNIAKANEHTIMVEDEDDDAIQINVEI